MSAVTSQFYTGNSDKTRAAYESLLNLVRQFLGPEGEIELLEITEEVIRIARAANATIDQKRRELTELFPQLSKGNQDVQKIMDITAELTDFVGEGDADATGRGGASEAIDPRDFFSEEEDSDDDEGNSKYLRRAQLIKDGFALTTDGFGDGGGEGDDESGPILTVQTMESDYVKKCLRNFFPQDSDQELEERVKQCTAVLGNQTTASPEVVLNLKLNSSNRPEVREWVSNVVRHRWAVIYGQKLAAAESLIKESGEEDPETKAIGEDMKKTILDQLKEHAMESEGAEAVWMSLGNDRVSKVKARGAAGAGGIGGAANSSSYLTEDASALGDLKSLDLDGLKLGDMGSGAVAGAKPILPKGHQTKVFDSYTQVDIPMAKLFKGDESFTFIKVKRSFPLWAQRVWRDAGVKELNAMQSQVFPIAYSESYGKENMLVCAPTGAGKTNVALMCIMNVLRDHVLTKDPITGDTLPSPLGPFQEGDDRADKFNMDDDVTQFDTSDFKIVYIAPMKALVHEVAETFSKRFEPLGLTVGELSGDSAMSKHELEETNIIVTTPEKWDIVTRKGVETGVASIVRLIIIDEVHLLHNDRGPILEAIIARTKRQRELTGRHVRLVGLSATLPNYGDVGALLEVKPKSEGGRGLFHFDASFRGTPLVQRFCALRKTSGSRTVLMNDVCYLKVQEQLNEGYQCLVFVHGRKDTTRTGQFLVDKALREGMDRHLKPKSEDARQELSDESRAIRSEDLRNLVACGVGTHHAGMSVEDKHLMEDLFKRKLIRVLVCTSTLAWGVNLPAHAVIIKGTAVYAANKGAYSQLSALDVFQMFGRAGRKGLDTFGEAYLLTTPDQLTHYLSLLSQQLPIESQMVARLRELVNAEVALGYINSVQQGVEWLKRTYIYIRMRNNPRLYGLGRDVPKSEAKMNHYCARLIHSAFLSLAEAKCVVYRPATDRTSSTTGLEPGCVVGTPLGRIASHFNLSLKSMHVYQRLMTRRMDDVQLFRLFALSDEFSQVSVRPDEIPELKRLMADCPIPIQEDDMERSRLAKISILLQAHISDRRLDGFILGSEMAYIRDSGERILKAMQEIAVDRMWADTARKCQELYHMVQRKQWSVFSPLRQFSRRYLPRSMIRNVENCTQGDWERLFWMDKTEIANVAFNGNVDKAEQIHDFVHHVPRVEVTCIAKPLTANILRLELEVTPDFVFKRLYDEGKPETDDNRLHGRSLTFNVTCEDGTGTTLLYHDSFELTSQVLSKDDGESERESHNFRFAIPFLEPHPTHCFIRVSCAGWLGSETVYPLDLMPMVVPKQCEAPLDAHEMPPVTITAGGEEEEDTTPTTGAAAQNGGKVPTAALGEDVAPLFDEFEEFNKMQSQVLPAIWAPISEKQRHVFAGIPAGSGRSALAELAFLRDWKKLLPKLSEEGSVHNGQQKKIGLYITPGEAKASRKAVTWDLKYGVLGGGIRVSLLVNAQNDLERLLVEQEEEPEPFYQIVVATPATVLALIRREPRKKLHRLLWSHVSTVVFDDLQRIGSNEGPTYEQVTRKILDEVSEGAVQDPDLYSPRVVALSVPIIDVKILTKWLGSASEQLSVGGSNNKNPTSFFSGSGDSVSAGGVFNFNVTNRGHQVAIKPTTIPGFRNRMAFYQHSVFKQLVSPQRINSGAQIVFVPTADDARTFARNFFSRYRHFDGETLAEGVNNLDLSIRLSCKVAFLDSSLDLNDQMEVVRQVEEATMEALEHSTTPGAGEFFVFAPFSYGESLNAHTGFTHAYICGCEYAPPPGYLTAKEAPIAEVVTMASRARFSTTVYCYSQREFWWQTFLNDCYPLESLADSPSALDDILNSAVQERKADDMNGALSSLLQLFLPQRVRANPGFYDVPSSEGKHLKNFLSELVQESIDSLDELNCISYDGESERITGTPLGLIASRTCLPIEVLRNLQEFSSGRNAGEDGGDDAAGRSTSTSTSDSLGMLLWRLAGCSSLVDRFNLRYSELEKKSVGRLFDVLEGTSIVPRWVFRQKRKLFNAAAQDAAEGWDISGQLQLKVFTLLAAHCARIGVEDIANSFSAQLACDYKEIIVPTLDLIKSAVDVMTQVDLSMAFELMTLSQCLTQALWITDSELMQLPHIDHEMISTLRKDYGVTTIDGLTAMEDEEAQKKVFAPLLIVDEDESLLKDALPNDGEEGDVAPAMAQLSKMDELAEVANGRIPNLEVTYVQTLFEEAGIWQCDVTISNIDGTDLEEEGEMPELHAPHLPASPLASAATQLSAGHLQKVRPGYWLVVLAPGARGPEEPDQLKAMKYFYPLSKTENVRLKFQAAEGSSTQNFKVRLICDSYLRLDYTGRRVEE